MTYTHCRGCGVGLESDWEQMDGLCAADPSCTAAAAKWLRERGFPVDAMVRRGNWASPAWSVAIDEWLQATQ